MPPPGPPHPATRRPTRRSSGLCQEGPLSCTSEQQNETTGHAELTANTYQRDVHQATSSPVEHTQRARPESQRGANKSPQRGEGFGHGGLV
eukprot:6337709-Pyramimonas_sp.AAC.1